MKLTLHAFPLLADLVVIFQFAYYWSLFQCLCDFLTFFRDFAFMHFCPSAPGMVEKIIIHAQANIFRNRGGG